MPTNLDGAPRVVHDHASQEDFRGLVDGIVDYGIFMLSVEGAVLTWNEGARRMLGYSAQEIVGRSLATFYLPGDAVADGVTAALTIARETGRFEDEGWRVRKDGTAFWANVVLTALHDASGSLRGFGNVTRDLSERRMAEQLLRDSEERVRLMVESVRDYAIIRLDPAGIISSWNVGAERIKGWSAQEIVGKSFETFYPPEDVAAGKTTRELAIAASTGSCEDHGWRVRKDGSRFWANVVITALRDEAGVLRGYAKVTRDITDRRLAEEALRKAYEELEAFSYSVSHDLRAPLRSMDGFSDELLRRYGDQLDARGKDYLSRIRVSAQRMSRLIDDLLNLARLGRTKMVRELVDLTAMAEKVIEELRRVHPRRVVEVVVAPNLTVHADPTLMRVVLDNLLGNAWKYTSQHERARIELGTERRDGLVSYFVRDDGAGFDMEFRSKLFGPFQRLHASDAFTGMGIGLATVKRIVQRHGGDVFAHGAVEAGATVGFHLGGHPT
jgi:PAS domain S-box-containing protein